MAMERAANIRLTLRDDSAKAELAIEESARRDAFDAQLKSWRARMELALEARLPDSNAVPARLHQAMRYSVLGAGKRVRPMLLFATACTLGLAEDEVEAAACAVELVHAYSLVHDDLPAMDDDDLRRGRPTCHKAYDEATAVLVGDALQPLAFQLRARDPPATDRATGRGERHFWNGRRTGDRSGRTRPATRHSRCGGDARSQDRRTDSRERVTGRGLRALTRPSPVRGAGRFCDSDRSRIPDSG